MQVLLRAKHWQIFLLLSIPLLCIFGLRSILSPLHYGFMWLLLFAVELAWLFAIGSASNARVPENLRRNQQLFLLAPFVCIMLLGVVLAMLYSAFQTQQPPPPWLIYLVFAALAAFFYTLWFAASQFATAEKQDSAFYIEYAFPMLGLWFGVVGAWFLQPRVNRLLGE
ncbi:MAG: hypothetical protein AAF434_10305 [Pseudomonadota bacterium]